MKPRRILFSLLLWGCLCCPLLWAISPDRGAALYAEGNYPAAIEAMLAERPKQPSASYYYNLGSAYLQTGDYAHAILALLRADRLQPGDPAIQQNLALANSHTVDRFSYRQPYFHAVYTSAYTALSTGGWLALSLSTLALTIAAFALLFLGRTRLLRRVGFFSGVGFLACLTLSCIAMASSAHRLINPYEMVVMVGQTPLRNGPMTDSKSLIELSAGSRVKALSLTPDNGMLPCQAPNGESGWLSIDALAAVYPLQ